MIKYILFSTVLVFSSAIFAINAENPSPSKTICSPTECYILHKELGEGAFGKVWEVENSKGQRLAMKSYKNHEDNPWFADSLFADAEREFMHGQKLNHNNIVKTIELFKDYNDQGNPTTYLVLDLVNGKPYYKIPKKSLLDNASLKSCLQLVDALQYALSEGYVYIDLHAGNIMLTDSLDTMVVDLASFYSFDEVLALAKNLNQKGNAIEKAIHKNNFHEEKLHKFFQQNPDILSKIQEEMNNTVIAKGPSLENDQYKIMMPMLSYNLERISELCIHLINRSDLDRETKINLFVSIKKLAWNYAEDTDEDLVIPVDLYLEQLVEVLSP